MTKALHSSPSAHGEIASWLSAPRKVRVDPGLQKCSHLSLSVGLASLSRTIFTVSSLSH